MTPSFKHIGLLIGIAVVFISFLFFGRQQDTYQILLIGGLATALIFYLLVLFGKGRVKTKIFWTVVVIICITIQRLTKPSLIDISYRIYISQNKNVLTEINNILVTKQGDIIILNDDIKGGQLTPLETNKLQEGRKKLGVYIITKSSDGIYYGLWGFLDVRLSIKYWTGKNEPDNRYRHLTTNWVY